MKTNLVKCLRCRKTLIHEEYPDHVCTPVLTGTKEIRIDYWWRSKNANGEITITAKGLDGVLYTLIQSEERACIPISDESLQGEDDRRRLDSTYEEEVYEAKAPVARGL